MILAASRRAFRAGVVALLAGGLVAGFLPRAAAAERKSSHKAKSAGQNTPAEPAQKSVETLAETTRESLVTVGHLARGARDESQGTGFVISPEGLIATCFHVIGEGRPIFVRTADGRELTVTGIHAWDRKLDLAVLRVAQTNLTPLRLGNSDNLKQGASVVAIGNPLGLERSIVEGVVSARRDFDGVEMIQLAIPIEPGNSGGPLLDRQGRVHGLLTMKSLMTRNLGFATPVNALKLLLDQPNPTSLSRWLVRGSVSTNDWTPRLGARWFQRAGHIEVEGLGNGFGGRALLLAKQTPPPRPYELTVTVKLEDESGAAGLAFDSDGGDRHYGFYPTAGQLRLTRFDGPVVSDWKILQTVPSEHYRRGDWNILKVRVEPDKISGYVNGHLVITSEDQGLEPGLAGLAKFRDTKAAFKNFAVANTLPSVATVASAETKAQVDQLARAKDPATEAGLLDELRLQSDVSRVLLREHATQLELDAARLRRLAASVHTRAIATELAQALSGPEERIDLARATLLLSRLDNPDLDIPAYLRQLDKMAREAMSLQPAPANDAAKLKALLGYLFVESGFHGSRLDYYNRANSYLDQVLDDHEGIPITLSVLVMEIARRAGLGNVHGIPVPTHFMVKFAPVGGEETYLDVFNGGKVVTRTDIAEITNDNAGVPLRDEFLRAATKKEIIVRMLRNLFEGARRASASGDALRYLDLLVALSPESAAERLDRAMLRLDTGDRPGAKEDLKWLLDREPAGIQIERLTELYRSL